jgi:excisionase family DNA binding protein
VNANNVAEFSVMTVEDVSHRYKVHSNTVYKMVKDGRLKAGGTGKALRFSPAECDQVFLGIEKKEEVAA